MIIGIEEGNIIRIKYLSEIITDFHLQVADPGNSFQFSRKVFARSQRSPQIGMLSGQKGREKIKSITQIFYVHDLCKYIHSVVEKHVWKKTIKPKVDIPWRYFLKRCRDRCDAHSGGKAVGQVGL